MTILGLKYLNRNMFNDYGYFLRTANKGKYSKLWMQIFYIIIDIMMMYQKNNSYAPCNNFAFFFKSKMLVMHYKTTKKAMLNVKIVEYISHKSTYLEPKKVSFV